MSNETLGIIVYFVIMMTWVIYLTQEMFIIGASSLNKIAAKNEEERKQVQVITGLHFDGVEVWLIAAFTMLLAAFPKAFSLTFEHLYIPIFLLLYAIIGRGVAIEVIYKLDSKKWIKAMVNTWTISSILIIFFLGIYITNLFYGFPYDGTVMTSSFGSMFNVTTIAGGLFFVALSLVSGAAWIDKMTEGDLGERALSFVKKTGFIYVIPVTLLLVLMGLNNQSTSIFIGELYSSYWVLYILPLLAVIAAIITAIRGFQGKGKCVFRFSIITMAFYVMSGFVGAYPNVIQSNVAITNDDLIPNIENFSAASGPLTIILIAVVIFYPLILFYQGWKYKKFSDKVQLNDE
jgi:cytochrome d ubiquinol oxidase subunit II